jgi:hypothetical protein
MDKSYRRRWEVYLRGERIGEVLGATQQAACARAIQRFKIDEQNRSQLEVRRISGPVQTAATQSNE